MLAMLMLPALARRVLRLLARSLVLRWAISTALVGAVLAVLLTTRSPGGSHADGMAAVAAAAASANASGTCAGETASRRWAEMARRGELDALAALADGGAGGFNDAQAYKWLAAAEDFGHARAEVMRKSLLETTSLRHDDDGLLVGQMHHELGLAYLSGCEGLPNNLQLARQHLEWGREGIMGTEHDLAADRRGLSPAALEVFDEVFPPAVLAAAATGAGAADAGGADSSAPPAAPPALTARMVDFGLYRSARLGHRKDDNVAGGLVQSHGRELLRQTDRVPATLGTGFGFRYVLQGPADEAEVTVRVLQPVPLRDPESGRSIAVSEWQQRLPVGKVNWNSGWNFEYAWELVPGRWTIQLHGQSGLLLEKHFEVAAP